MADATLLLLAMALGATVVLAVLRLSQDESRSMRASSAELLRMATDSLNASATLAQESVRAESREAARDRSLAELSRTVSALETTVGHVFLQSQQQNRTVLQRPLQVGEAPPGSPGVARVRTQQELPPEGLATPGSSPAAESTRQRAFAEPT